jgi:hypothetical protein
VSYPLPSRVLFRTTKTVKLPGKGKSTPKGSTFSERRKESTLALSSNLTV